MLDSKDSNLKHDLTKGSIVGGLFRFALPLMVGNVLQQCYNIADTLIVGRFVGARALAAVGSAYTLMIFITSVILGLSMGAGAYLSMKFGSKEEESFGRGNALSFSFIGIISVILNVAVSIFIDPILNFLQVPSDVYFLMREYTAIIFTGIMAVFLYNYFASVLRAVGNSMVPLIFLGCSAVLNIILDLYFVISLDWGIAGAAWATVISQYVSGLGITAYVEIKVPELRLKKKYFIFDREIFKSIANLSLLTCLQQSIMNFGILLVQGRVNYFGSAVMAAFAAAVKIDTLAYSPVQDFGNAFSTFIAQNHGAGEDERIRVGSKKAAVSVLIFCLIISSAVFFFGGKLMSIFTENLEIISIGANYLKIEGAFYCLIGFLFMFYGYYRAVERPSVSVVLTVISLGTRVILAYVLSAIPAIGYTGIWLSIPIGWALADIAGLLLLKQKNVECR